MSGYFWSDSFFENKNDYEEIRQIMNDNLDKLVGKHREFAIYRFGLDGQKEHSFIETVEHFSLSHVRVKALESSILRTMGIRMPTIRPKNVNLKQFLEE